MPGNHEALANVGKIVPLHAITNPHTKSLNEIELRLDTPRSIEGAREVKIYQQALCPSCPLYKYNTCTGIRFSIHSSYDLDSDKDRHLQNLKLNLRIFIIK